MKVLDSGFLVELREVTDYIVENGFKYGYSSTADNWKDAKKEKTCTCSTMVSIVLQNIGVLKPGMIINFRNGILKYINHKGSAADVKKQLFKYFTMLKVNKKWKDWKKSARPGDVVGFENHTAVYAGSNSNGDIWYDSGTGSTYNKKKGSKFKDCHRPINRDNQKIYYVLRWKEEYRDKKL